MPTKKETTTNAEELRRAMSRLGSVSSPAKTRAARENGKLGGRPSKKGKK